MQPEKQPLTIIGHRGAAGLAFENTLASIRKAIDLGLSMIEFDVWKTTDNEIVVFHDSYLDRLTNGSGFIAEKSLPELQNLLLKNGATIPTLTEVLRLVKAYPVTIIVEVKAENAFSETFRILKEMLPFSRFILGSFYHRKVTELKQQNPELQTAIMLEGVLVDLDSYLQKINPDYVVASIDTQNEYLAETVKAQNRRLCFYTVNTEAEFQMALKHEPFGIITNYPDRFLKKQP